jgi:hypothetical protein
MAWERSQRRRDGKAEQEPGDETCPLPDVPLVQPTLLSTLLSTTATLVTRTLVPAAASARLRACLPVLRVPCGRLRRRRQRSGAGPIRRGVAGFLAWSGRR